jgi:hypothetical protein
VIHPRATSHRRATVTWRGVCSVLALLILAQLDAQAHAYSHDDELAPSHAKHVHSKLCSECASFSALLTGHGETASVAVPPPVPLPSYDPHPSTAPPEFRLIPSFSRPPDSRLTLL